MTDPKRDSKLILCVGTGWFPQSPSGLERYVFELKLHLAENKDCVELCGVGLPTTFCNSPIQLTNLCEPSCPMWQRLWSTRHQFLNRKIVFPDAINLPLLYSFPPKSPLTFTFHGPWAFESAQEGGKGLNVFVKQWIENRVYRRCDRFIVHSAKSLVPSFTKPIIIYSEAKFISLLAV
jgi:Glycosyltransferase Family 4